MTKIYAGIGSRKTPSTWLGLMRCYAKELSELGWHLRSGGAQGADTAFAEGAALESGGLTVYRPRPNETHPQWAVDAIKSVAKEHPFRTMSDYTQSLLIRNMYQVAGESGDEPVNFVVCWTPTLDPCAPNAGGTLYACRYAKSLGIPVFNLHSRVDEHKFREAFENIKLAELF